MLKTLSTKKNREKDSKTSKKLEKISRKDTDVQVSIN